MVGTVLKLTELRTHSLVLGNKKDLWVWELEDLGVNLEVTLPPLRVMIPC